MATDYKEVTIKVYGFEHIDQIISAVKRAMETAGKLRTHEGTRLFGVANLLEQIKEAGNVQSNEPVCDGNSCRGL